MKLKSWDGNNINDGTNYDAVLNANFQGLPGIRAILGYRHGSWPILGGVDRPGRELNFDIYIRSGSSLELAQWFDPEDETSKQLIVEDDDGSNDRFVNAICTEFREVPYSAGLQYAVTVEVDGDVRWREIAITTASDWDITATGQSKIVANNGQDKAFPILKIKPTSAKSVGFDYKRFIIMKWFSSNSAIKYPTDITDNAFDTDALQTAGKIQADLDDLRVYVDGVEVDRWLDPAGDDPTTKVWVNLDFSANITMTLNGGINNSVAIIDVNEDINNMPNSGILYIGTELVVYTAKNNTDKQFTGCTRGAKGSSAAAHADNADCFWIQHDIWIYYGDSTLSAPAVDDDYKPAFVLTNSTNSSWNYDNFGDNAGKRSGAWIFSGNAKYTANRLTFATPWSEMGIWITGGSDSGLWKLINPHEITNFNFANGEKYSSDYPNYDAKVRSWDGSVWDDEYTIPDPSADDTWEAWSYNAAPGSGAIGAGLQMDAVGSTDMRVEVSDVTLTLTGYPDSIIGSEQANYPLSCEIYNYTTGDKIELDFGMELDEELEVDTDEKTVVYLADNSNQFNALKLTGGTRKKWLPLDVGNNTIIFNDVGTGNVTIVISWWERYYE